MNKVSRIILTWIVVSCGVRTSVFAEPLKDVIEFYRLGQIVVQSVIVNQRSGNSIVLIVGSRQSVRRAWTSYLQERRFTRISENKWRRDYSRFAIGVKLEGRDRVVVSVSSISINKTATKPLDLSHICRGTSLFSVVPEYESGMILFAHNSFDVLVRRAQSKPFTRMTVREQFAYPPTRMIRGFGLFLHKPSSSEDTSESLLVSPYVRLSLK